jgi:hypothetical protein
MSNTNNLKNNKCDTHGSNCDGACVDPNVDNGMMTKVWGPAGWLFLHCVSFGYPYAINNANESHKDKRDDYYNFFYYLGKVLPCRYCRESYEEFFKELDLSDHLNTRKQLTKWLYDMHNKVNHKLGVPECNIPSFDELINRYESYRAKCKKTTDEERLNNQKKGCVTPANGTPQKCIVKVVSYDKGDITRRDNSNSGYFNDTQDDYIVFKKRTILIILLALLILIGAILYFK